MMPFVAIDSQTLSTLSLETPEKSRDLLDTLGHQCQADRNFRFLGREQNSENLVKGPRRRHAGSGSCAGFLFAVFRNYPLGLPYEPE